MKTKWIMMLLFFMLLSGIAFSQSFQVVVNVANTTTSLTTKEVSDMFLKKKKKWDDGTVVKPVDLNSSSEIRSEFSNTIHKRNTAAIRSFWQQAAFSGAGTAPVEKRTSTDVIAYVKLHEGAIGYISTKTSSSGVKVIKIK